MIASCSLCACLKCLQHVHTTGPDPSLVKLFLNQSLFHLINFGFVLHFILYLKIANLSRGLFGSELNILYCYMLKVE